YERFLGRWTKLLARELAAFAQAPDAGKILDVGTGTGSLALELARTLPHAAVVGLDISEAYIAYAATFARPNLRFERGDAARLPYADADFDAVLSQLVLNFVPDYRRAAREMARVTKPGGTVAAAIWDFRGGLVYQRLLWDSIAGVDSAAASVRDRLFSHTLGI